MSTIYVYNSLCVEVMFHPHASFKLQPSYNIDLSLILYVKTL